MSQPDSARSDSVTGTAAFERGVRLFDLIVRDEGRTPLSTIARSIGMPPSTARRFAASMERLGLVVRAGRGRYAAGRKLAALVRHADPRDMLVRTSRPHLRRLARRTRATVHLGVLEADMVTYLVKERGGGAEIFTREGSQLEGYCTAVGKMLLAMLDGPQQEAYLGSSPFVALTEKTMTAPDAIRAALGEIRLRGYASEDGETADGLRCLAVPVLSRDGTVLAAISIARREPLPTAWSERLDLDDARQCAAALGRLFA